MFAEFGEKVNKGEEKHATPLYDIMKKLGEHFVPKNEAEYIHLLLFNDYWKKTINKSPPDEISIVRRDIFIISRLFDVNCLNDKVIEQIGYLLRHQQSFGGLRKILRNPEYWNTIIKSKIYQDVIKDIKDIKDKDTIIMKIWSNFIKDGFKDKDQLINKNITEYLHIVLDKQKEFLIYRELSPEDDNIMYNFARIKEIHDKWGNGCDITHVFKRKFLLQGGKKKIIKRTTKRKTIRKRKTTKKTTKKTKRKTTKRKTIRL